MSSKASQNSTEGDDFIRHEGVNCSYVTGTGKKCKIQTVHRDTGACKTHHRTVINARAKAVAKPNVKAKVATATGIDDIVNIFKTKLGGGGALGVRNQVVCDDEYDSDEDEEEEMYAEKLREQKETLIPVSSHKVFALKNPAFTDVAGRPLPPQPPAAPPVKKQTKTIVPKPIDVALPEYRGKISASTKTPKAKKPVALEDLLVSADDSDDESVFNASDISDDEIDPEEEELIRGRQVYACELLKDVFVEGGLGTLSATVPRYRGIDDHYRDHKMFNQLWPHTVAEVSEEVGFDMTKIKASHLMLAMFARDLAMYRAPEL